MEFAGIKDFLKTCDVQYMSVRRRNFTWRFFERPKRNHINFKSLHLKFLPGRASGGKMLTEVRQRLPTSYR